MPYNGLVSAPQGAKFPLGKEAIQMTGINIVRTINARAFKLGCRLMHLRDLGA